MFYPIVDFNRVVTRLFHFSQTRLRIEIPIWMQAVGILQSGSLADENPGQIAAEINTAEDIPRTGQPKTRISS